MKLKILGFVVFTFLFSCLFTLARNVSAVSESDCLNKSASQLTTGEMDECLNIVLPRIAAAYAPAQEKNKQDLANLKSQLDSLNKRITSISNELKAKEKEIRKHEEDMAFAQKILDEKARSQYIDSRLYDPVLSLLSASDASEVFRRIKLREVVADEDRKTIEKYSQDLLSLKEAKANLEKNKISLASLQKQVNEKTKFLQGEVDKVESYLSSLTARQNELIALKSGGFQTSIGDTPPTLEPCSGAPGSSNFCDPGFRPAFAAFSFGAPHRTGMSQYGAYGRSKSGQNAETILSAYYQGASLNRSYPTSANICVGSSKTSCSNVDLETYVKRIYEVPNGWGDNNGMEALKAQVVAARSYALYQMKGVGYICPTESCQVYKPTNKGGNWETAVNATSGWVLERGGGPAPTYYAASSGGYTISQWTWSGIKDAPGNWPDTAYEVIGGSPWFYKGWYKARSGAACGKTNPWLTSEELADVLNAWKVVYQGGGDVSRVSPIGSCWGGNPYSVNDLQGIGGFNSVSGASVIYSNNGSTVSISFQTNKDQVTISGGEFKKAFNLRAPGYLGIKSSLFNIEKL